MRQREGERTVVKIYLRCAETDEARLVMLYKKGVVLGEPGRKTVTWLDAQKQMK